MDIDEILQRVEAIHDCAADIRMLSADFDPLGAEVFEAALEQAMTQGAQKTIGRLLLCAGYLDRKLNPQLLSRCLDAAEKEPHVTLAFRALGELAVSPLLEAAEDAAQVFNRRAFALALAANLILEHNLDRNAAKKVLWKLETDVDLQYDPGSRLLLSGVSRLLTLGKDSDPVTSLLFGIATTLETILPEQYQRKAVPSYVPLRRVVRKLGRNEPCHCGSGKKYKKCCFERDQELQSDASEFEGVTRSSLLEDPGQVDDHRMIYTMRSFELQRLNPSSLTLSQLHAASRIAQNRGLWELALRMLLEAERRDGQDGEPFHWGYYADLLFAALHRGELAFAQKMREKLSGRELLDDADIKLRFALLENPAPYVVLEEPCRQSLLSKERQDFLTPLQDLFLAVVLPFPALGIVLGRALLAANQESFMEEDMVIYGIRRARIDLDLEPWGDPAETLLDWIDDREQFKAQERKDSEQAQRVKEQLDAARKELDRKQHELLDREHQVERLNRDLEQAEEARRDQGSEVGDTPAEEDTQRSLEREKMLARLRNQVRNLKAEIGEQQQERRRLRSELTEERKRSAAAKDTSPPSELEASPEIEDASPQPIGKIIIPEYSSAFTKHCGELPPQVAADALQAIGDFAAHDRTIWRKTKPLERLNDHYRMRIGIDYRLLFQWKAGESLRILDIIRRAELDAWIRRHG